jgi:hypothetical protein
MQSVESYQNVTSIGEKKLLLLEDCHAKALEKNRMLS